MAYLYPACLRRISNIYRVTTALTIDLTSAGTSRSGAERDTHRFTLGLTSSVGGTRCGELRMCLRMTGVYYISEQEYSRWGTARSNSDRMRTPPRHEGCEVVCTAIGDLLTTYCLCPIPSGQVTCCKHHLEPPHKWDYTTFPMQSFPLSGLRCRNLSDLEVWGWLTRYC